MAGIQRFFTYIYAYENDNKNQNVGFAKVDIRGDYCQIEIHLKRTGYTNMKCPVYLFSRKEKEMTGVEIGQITLNNGSGDFGRRLSSNQIGDSSYCIHDMKGIIIFLTETVMFASQWDEKEIQRADFKKYDKSMQEKSEEMKVSGEGRVQKEQTESAAQERANVGRTVNAGEVQQKTESTASGWGIREETERPTGVRGVREGAERATGVGELREGVERLTGNREAREETERATDEQKVRNEAGRTAGVQESREETERMTSGQETRAEMERLSDEQGMRENSQRQEIWQDETMCKPGETTQKEEAYQEAEMWTQGMPKSEMPKPEMQKTGMQKPEMQEEKNSEAQEWKETGQLWSKLANRHGEVRPFEGSPEISCIKIELKDLKELPKQYWYLGSNSFLLHGFFNYHYLLLGKIPEQNREKWFVGVPGVFQNQERILAGIFGFPEFKQEKNTEAKTNQYGYWYRLME